MVYEYVLNIVHDTHITVVYHAREMYTIILTHIKHIQHSRFIYKYICAAGSTKLLPKPNIPQWRHILEIDGHWSMCTVLLSHLECHSFLCGKYVYMTRSVLEPRIKQMERLTLKVNRFPFLIAFLLHLALVSLLLDEPHIYTLCYVYYSRVYKYINQFRILLAARLCIFCTL